jgi:hypothetical protein
LAAAETAVGEEIIEFGGSLAHQVGEYLSLFLSRQIGTRRGSG